MSIDHYIVNGSVDRGESKTYEFDTISAACAYAKGMRDKVGGQWKVYKVVETAVYGKAELPTATARYKEGTTAHTEATNGSYFPSSGLDEPKGRQ